MARPPQLVYIERMFLIIILGLVSLVLLVAGEERASAQSVYSMGLVAVTYFIGERTGSLGFSGGAPTYLGVAVWLVYFMSFVFLVFASVTIDLDDKPGRPKLWCQLSILSCASIYCCSKLGVVHVLIERLRMIRNTGVSRFKDKHWMATMMLLFPYTICLVLLLVDMVHDYRGTKCYIGVERRGIISVLSWNAITSCTLGYLYLKTFLQTNESLKNYHIPRGMSKISIVSATSLWILTSCGNLSSYLVEIKLREHVCLMACAADIVVGIVVSDYLSGLTAARLQQDEMAIVVATKVANMDLDNLDYLFEIENPTVIQSSFRSITAILRQYKAYVPASVLENIDDIIHVATPVDVIQPPDGMATVVFTDIVASSYIWGELPGEMRDALAMHNRIVRECISECRGYEVKTIGDSFMTVFESPSDGIEFGLLVHLRLFEAIWPEQLSQLPPCSSGSVWNGLRVRIGIHHGQVNSEGNNTTGRVDYLGSTVNIAARLEGICDPGAIAVSYSTLTTAQEFLKQNAPLIIDKGQVHLRGIKEPTTVSVVYPSSLSGRIEKSDQQHSILVRERPSSPTRSNSDIASSVSSRNMIRKRGEENSFRKISATVGRHVVRPRPCDYQLINDTLSLVSTCLIRTDGITMGVTGNIITFSWNVSKSVEKHALASLRFADIYASYQRRGYHNSLKSVVALSSSSLHTGFVKSGEEKFVTVLGDALGLTSAQLQLAEDEEVFCTYSSSDPSNIEYLDPVLQEVSRVTVNKSLSYPEKVAIYEVSVIGWAGKIEMETSKNKLVIDTSTPLFQDVKLSDVGMKDTYCTVYI